MRERKLRLEFSHVGKGVVATQWVTKKILICQGCKWSVVMGHVENGILTVTLMTGAGGLLEIQVCGNLSLALL